MADVTLRAVSGDVVRFPAVCVYSGEPASARLPIAYRWGVRELVLDVPVSTAVYNLLQRRSYQEERWLRISWAAATLVGVVVLAGVLLWLNAALAFRLFIGSVAALLAAVLVLAGFQPIIDRHMLPEKADVYRAAKIVAFDGRSLTISFRNDAFAAQVRALNETLLENPKL
ncbi:MAG: hypothetical protein D6835_02200 [Candidatus Thermofonsia bacterium]|nr:MAG: hypothetical protein D6835_02200 [Candidatus Thermofonsia bacterium]